jgi:GT2 family glycosyltransferase
VRDGPFISVIIVNYNGRDLLKTCLESIQKQSFQNLEIIVVDNASSDGSVEYIKKSFTDMHIIPLPENLGFAGANLEGFRSAEGDYLFLLNNDTEVDSECISRLYDAMESNPDAGICASKIIVHGQEIIDSAGDGYATSLKGFKRGEGQSSRLYDREEHVFGACAGAALYRRKMLDEIGFLDEDFFLIHEDTDLNFRAQLTGWKVLFVPDAVVYHKVRSSIGQMSDTAVYYTLRNSEFVRVKNVPFMLFLRCLPEFILGTISEIIYFGFKHGKLMLYIKAKADVVRNLRSLLGKRRENLGMKKTDNRYLCSIMTPVFDREFLSEKIKKLFFR